MPTLRSLLSIGVMSCMVTACSDQPSPTRPPDLEVPPPRRSLVFGATFMTHDLVHGHPWERLVFRCDSTLEIVSSLREPLAFKYNARSSDTRQGEDTVFVQDVDTVVSRSNIWLIRYHGSSQFFGSIYLIFELPDSLLRGYYTQITDTCWGKQ